MPSAVISSLDSFGTCRRIYALSKGWWASSLFARLCAFLATVLGIMHFIPSSAVPYSVAILALLAECSVFRADHLKGLAQTLQAEAEFADSIGGSINPRVLADCLASVPTKLHVSGSLAASPYFASDHPPGPLRFMDNVGESAWWSKHLAKTAVSVLTAALVLAGLVSFVSIVVAVQVIGSPETSEQVARIVTALLMLAMSLSLFRLRASYAAFATTAANVEDAAERSRQAATATLAEAQSLWMRYQMARALAPPIPDVLWKVRKSTLNKLWTEYRVSRASTSW